jgi:adenosylcobinamide kinase/adenosylcobinamide-phosphate guanylyltransferase
MVQEEQLMSVPQSARVLLVLGGVRSGKSRYAQRVAEQVEHVTFVATAEQHDDAEMRAKIARHQADRPESWLTIEEPLELTGVIRQAGSRTEMLLIDCLTLFAANLLQACGEDSVQSARRVDDLCAALQAAPCRVVLVSNEVGSGVVPAYALGRRFRDLAGEINQRVAAVADTVVLMVAGLPLLLKGKLPEDVR